MMIKIVLKFLKNDTKLNQRLFSSTTKLLTTKSDQIEASSEETFKEISESFILENDFLSEAEEESILNEINPYMKRLRYEFDHWDNVIHGYRETERLQWTQPNQAILNRVKQFAFDSFKNDKDDIQSDLLAHVHILDLHETGFIKPHVE
jgi:hypothetical protein